LALEVVDEAFSVCVFDRAISSRSPAIGQRASFLAMVCMNVLAVNIAAGWIVAVEGDPARATHHGVGLL
jgi:hypothetical protein